METSSEEEDNLKKDPHNVTQNAVTFFLLMAFGIYALVDSIGEGSAPGIVLIAIPYVGVTMFFGVRTLLQAILKKRSAKRQGIPKSFSLGEKISLWLVTLTLLFPFLFFFLGSFLGLGN